MSSLFALIGFPARILGRTPLFMRFIWAGSDIPTEYSMARFGLSYRLKPWLLLDVGELEVLERLINEGTDEELAAFRSSELTSAAGTAVVGALLTSAASSILTLDSLAEVHYTVRGIFMLSLMLSLLSVYFTLIQQRELNIADAQSLRLWLWDGQTRPDHRNEGLTVRQSSLTSNIVLQAPFELLGISIALFLVGLCLYFGLVFAANVTVATGADANKASFIAFIVITLFTLAMFGQALGNKDRELARCRKLEEETNAIAVSEAYPERGGGTKGR